MFAFTLAALTVAFVLLILLDRYADRKAEMAAEPIHSRPRLGIDNEKEWCDWRWER